MTLSLGLSFSEIIKAVKAVDFICVNNKNTHITDISNTNVKNILNISTDSRKNMPDSLFFAIKGDIFDGHDFVMKAVENGAIGVVVKKDYMNYVKESGLQILQTKKTNNVIFIMVDDTVQALLDLSKYYKSLCNPGKVIAVTGSVGKTATKEFIYSVMSEKFKTQKNDGNYNNEMGLPLTIFNLKKGTETLILEMGMNSFGEISRLSKTANPNTAVITNIGTSHIENLGSQEGIKKAKFEILDGMNMNGEGNIILNADDPLLYCEKGKTGKNEYFFGITNIDADFIAENITSNYELNTSRFDTVIKQSGEVKSFTVPAVGIHNIYNALSAIITGIIYGLTDIQIQNGLNKFENAKMRQNIYDFHDITIIDDCYNASLESIKAALNVLCEISDTKNNIYNKNGRKIAVLSDILETGEYAEEIHSKIGEIIAEKNIDIIFLYGENSKITWKKINAKNNKCKNYYFTEKDKISESIYNEIKKGDIILFKASRGMYLETVLDDFKNKFISIP